MCASCAAPITLTLSHLFDRVKRGITLLDKLADSGECEWAVNWRSKVDMSSVDMQDETRCILGQLLDSEGGYWQMGVICESIGVTWIGSEYGFDFYYREVVKDFPDKWAALASVWSVELENV